MKTILTFGMLIFLYSFSFGQDESEMVFKRVEKADSIALHETFVELIAAIEQRELEKVKKVSLADIDCILCISSNYKNGPPKDYIVPIDTFYHQAIMDFVGSPLYKAIKTRGYKAYSQIIKNYKPKNLPKRYPKDLHIYELWIQTYKPNEWADGHEGQSHAFQFVKINNKFKFYGLTSVP